MKSESKESSMSESKREPGEERKPNLRFWPLVGLVLGADLILTLIYTLIKPGVNGQIWSDALCTSAVLLGIGSGLPFLFDAGRGLTLVGKMGGDETARHTALRRERRRRERGMTITFALALAAFITGLVSLVISLF
jgi:hypothetical protein